MNRAARRRAERQAGKTKITVRVRNQVAIVPMQHVETYFSHKIAREGQWAGDRELILIRPAVDVGRVDGDWFPRTLERMRETRQRKGTIPIKIEIVGGADLEVDVGLIDISVFFEMPPGIPPSLPTTRAEFDKSFTENFRHFDSVCAGGLDDQMIVGTAMHRFHSDGSPLLHYHNLIFGLRQEVRGDLDILGPLDMDPLLQKLAKSGPLSVVGGEG